MLAKGDSKSTGSLLFGVQNVNLDWEPLALDERCEPHNPNSVVRTSILGGQISSPVQAK